MSENKRHDYAMKGCICKKHTSPYYYAEITYTQTNGSVKRISRSTKCKRKYDAVKRMEEIIKELEYNLASSEKDSQDLVGFIENWLYNVEAKEIEATTFATYQMHFDAYIQPYFEPLGLTIDELRPSHLWNFVEHMQSKKTNRGTPLKTASIKKVVSNIKLALDYAIKKEIIEMNPAEAVKLKTKRNEKYEHSFYTVDQLVNLWKLVKGTTYEPAVVLASILGIRRGEVCGLIWNRVDFEEQTVRIEKAVVYAGSKPVVKNTKTEASNRAMPMISPMRAYLKKLKNQQKDKAKQLGRAWKNSGYVVVDDFGAMLRPDRVTCYFRDLLEKNNMPPIRFHDLRHSVGTYMLSMGVPIAEISAWLGHKSVTTTANIYAHVTDEMRKGAAIWMDGDYNPDGNGKANKMTLEEAILKLFEIVLEKDEIAQVKQKSQSRQKEEKIDGTLPDQEKYVVEREQNGERTEDKPHLRVIRGNVS